MEREKMSNFQVGIIVVAVLIFIGIFANLIDGNDTIKEPKNDNQKNVSEETSKNDNQKKENINVFEETPEESSNTFKRYFMKGCVKSEAFREYCECSWERLDRNYTNEELMNIGFDMKEKDISALPQKVKEIFSKCANKVE